jgi:glycosyltransferase involved in cell wall biosynthesis
LRAVDLRAANRVTRFVAISTAVASKIKQFYGRDSHVVHPPLLLDGRTGANRKPADPQFLLGVGRFASYKAFDQIVSAGVRLGIEVVLVGSGPEENALRTLGGSRVRILGHVRDRELGELYSSALAVVLAGEEDWGMVAIEAAAYGCPVIAARRGGALETVVDGVTGVLYDPDDSRELDQAIAQAQNQQWDHTVQSAYAETFSEQRFHREFADVLQDP